MRLQPRCTHRDSLLDILMSPTVAPGDTSHFIDLLEREFGEDGRTGKGSSHPLQPTRGGTVRDRH